MSKDFEVRRITTDVLIIGGGTAGCYAALTLSRDTELSIVIAEKAHIKRSGCLAAGVNAINAYITKGHVPQDYVDYAKKDAAGIVREDLLLTAAEHFNEVTADMEQLGLVILKDENGEYVTRGNRNIKINGENFKPILAKAVQAQENVSILNRVNITKLLTKGGAVYGAVGFSLEDEEAYVIEAKAVLVATGGAAGLYKPNNPGFSRHKMWYPPFNTGAGYAMGIQAGAEMTSFEMRFIALRCKDTIAPTGTIAQGVGARQVNSRGFVYEDKYGLTTSERVYGTVKENQQGNGPCYLQTSGIDKEQEENLLKAYLNMAPSQTLKWIETGELPGEQDVEIEGTEPYIVGGHTASGYWVDTNRETTIHGLYAAGDVAGGCPQKYVTGALAEGELAAKAIEAQLIGNAKVSDGKAGPFENDLAKKAGSSQEKIKKYIETEAGQEIDAYRHILSEHKSSFTAEELEEAMQKVMDEYAGGISTHYQYNEKQLKLADEKIDQLIALADQLAAENMHELLFVYELKERLIVCKSLIAHLRGRKETRWHSFNENLDYPETDENYFKYVNSRLVDGKLQIILRDIVKEGSYEHTN
jgi:adenylylsulfate reductase subunit A